MSGNNSTVKLPNLLTISQAARILNITTTTLRRWDDAGILGAVRVGSRQDRRYKKSDILDVLTHGTNILKD